MAVVEAVEKRELWLPAVCEMAVMSRMVACRGGSDAVGACG